MADLVERSLHTEGVLRRKKDIATNILIFRIKTCISCNIDTKGTNNELRC